MNIQTEYKDSLNAVINMEISADDYRADVDKAVKKYAQKASMPGFRPGKVPAGMVRKMAGKGLILETLNDVIGSGLFQHIGTEKLDILGMPLAVSPLTEDSVDLDCTKSVNISFEIGLAPAFEVSLAPAKTLDLYSIEVDEAFVEEQIHSLRERFAEMSETESVVEGSWVMGQLVETDADGKEVEGGYARFVSLNPTRVSNAEAFAPLMDKKVGDSTPYDSLKYMSEEEAKKIFFLQDEDIEKLKTITTNFSIRRISKMKLAEMDATFFEKVLEYAVADEAEFQKEFRARLEESVKMEASNYFFVQAKKAILETNPVSLPADFLKKWLRSTDEKKQINDENVDEVYARYEENFRWEIIEGKLRKIYDELTPSEEAYEEELREAIRKVPGALLESDEDTLVRNLMKDKDFVRQQRQNVDEKRLRLFLEANVPHNTATITASEFRKIEW